MPCLLKSSGEETLRETFAIKRLDHRYCKGQVIQRRSEGHCSKGGNFSGKWALAPEFNKAHLMFLKTMQSGDKISD